jgi:hypothetical protein
MRISPTPSPVYKAAARPQAVTQAPAPAPRAAEGPPPEYSLWSILKDIGARIVSGVKRLFGRD